MWCHRARLDASLRLMRWPGEIFLRKLTFKFLPEWQGASHVRVGEQPSWLRDTVSVNGIGGNVLSTCTDWKEGLCCWSSGSRGRVARGEIRGLQTLFRGFWVRWGVIQITNHRDCLVWNLTYWVVCSKFFDFSVPNFNVSKVGMMIVTSS